jgi:hypothetical protein
LREVPAVQRQIANRFAGAQVAHGAGFTLQQGRLGHHCHLLLAGADLQCQIHHRALVQRQLDTRDGAPETRFFGRDFVRPGLQRRRDILPQGVRRELELLVRLGLANHHGCAGHHCTARVRQSAGDGSRVDLRDKRGEKAAESEKS